MSMRYAIFGAGKSAQSARLVADNMGIEVVLFDEAEEGDQNSFDRKDLLKFDCLIFSPGFSAVHPWRVLAEGSGLPCLSEIAFAAKYWKGRIIGVTGTNGKSTVTVLIKEALELAGYQSVAAGNIGYTFSEAVLSTSNIEEAYAVVEISSFQAELACDLELDILIWTNFDEDHLDRYATLKDYFKAKACLLQCLKKESICIIGPQVAPWISELEKSFSNYISDNNDRSDAFDLSSESIFNQYPYSENYSLIVKLWRSMDWSAPALTKVADSFVLAPSHLSLVAEFGGSRYWDDSKATNFHATLAAFRSIDGPIVWIGGGRCKGGDLQAFAQKVARRVDVAILYGEVAHQMKKFFCSSLKSIYFYSIFEDAVHSAVKIGSSIPHANVLLSPGFSSLDQFNSYEERGKSFTHIVLSLKSSPLIE